MSAADAKEHSGDESDDYEESEAPEGANDLLNRSVNSELEAGQLNSKNDQETASDEHDSDREIRYNLLAKIQHYRAVAYKIISVLFTISRYLETYYR